MSAKPVVQAFNHGPPGFARTASVELGDIYRTASAISVFLEEADARPFINRLMSMPVMNAEGVVSRPVIDASTINPNIEVCPCAACLTGSAGCEPACLPVYLLGLHRTSLLCISWLWVLCYNEVLMHCQTH